MVLTLRQFSQTWWREVCRKVKKAVVFIDDSSAECLHWNGGMMELITAGAVAVKEFSSFESGLPTQKKAVFISSSPIFDVSETVLRDIIKNSKFEYCVLIYAAHQSVQQRARGGSSDMAALQKLEDDILHWMGNINFTVEIFYMPLFICPITETLFVTPPFKNLFPDINDIGEDNQTLSVHHLTSCFHSLFTQMNVREFIFSLGPLSGVLAGFLEDLPAAITRRKTAPNRASLILIDRTLDLCTVVKHNSDSVLDRILNVLPHLPNHSTDVAVNMSPICNAKVSSVLDDIYLAPGCLSQQNNDICSQILDWLVLKKQKDVMLFLTQQLASLTPSGKLERVPNRVTPHAIEKQVTAYRGNNDAILNYNGILQQALAVTQTLKSPRCSHLDMLSSLEMLQLQEGKTALAQLMQLIRTRSERKLSLEDLLCLLVHLYSSGSDILFTDAEESELELLLSEALYEDRASLTGYLSKLIDKDTEESTINSYATQICDKLQCLPSERYEHLQSPNGLIYQIATELFDPNRPEVIDLKAKSTALGELLKSGFNLFLNKPSSKHPLDNPMLIIFVVGGVSAREARLLNDVVVKSSNQQTMEVLIGGSRLLTPSDTMNAILLSDLITS